MRCERSTGLHEFFRKSQSLSRRQGDIGDRLHAGGTVGQGTPQRVSRPCLLSPAVLVAVPLVAVIHFIARLREPRASRTRDLAAFGGGIFEAASMLVRPEGQDHFDVISLALEGAVEVL